MKYLDYREKRQHGAFNFPLAYYSENPRAPRYVMPFHWHTEYELIYVSEGTFQVTADGIEYPLNKGQCLLLLGGVLHGGTPESCCYECVVFHPRMLLVSQHILAPIIQSLIYQTVTLKKCLFEAGTPIAIAAKELCAYLRERSAGYELLVQSSLYKLLGLLISADIICKGTSGSESGSPEPVKNALAYIEENHTKHLELGDIAEAAGLNPNYLCRLFKSYTGRTPIDYLRYYRIECACEMLATRIMTIPEVAWECGFHDPSYFSRCFKKEKGITPTQYLSTGF